MVYKIGVFVSVPVKMEKKIQQVKPQHTNSLPLRLL